MESRTRFATIAAISAFGLLLILQGLRAGASNTHPAPRKDEPAECPPIQLVQTITLDLTPHDLMTDTWPVRQESLEINSRGNEWCLPPDASDWSAGVSSGTYTFNSDTKCIYFANGICPGAEPLAWVTVTYHTRKRAVHSGDLVTLTTRINTSPQQWSYKPFTSTIVYRHPFPPGVAPDHWGYTPTHPYPISPPSPDPTESGDGWVRWITGTDDYTSTGNFTGIVRLREPLLGSDLKVTELLMDPISPTYGQVARFTATIRNDGPVTAWRWFATELYIRPVYTGAPQDALDHYWGWSTYGDPAMFLQREGDLPSFQVVMLTPSWSITLTALFTLTMQEPGEFRVYAQTDSSFANAGDDIHYAWFGANPEGYPDASNGYYPPEEKNNVYTWTGVISAGDTISFPVTYWLDAWLPITTLAGPPGGHANYWLQVLNRGNLTDTCWITVQNGFTTTLISGTLPAGSGTELPIVFDIPVTAADHQLYTTTVIAGSHGYPYALGRTRTYTFRIDTIAEWYRVYLPVVLRLPDRYRAYLPVVLKLR